MRRLLTITHLTLHETVRRRIVLAALVCGVACLILFATGFHFVERDVSKPGTTLIERRMALHFLLLAGLYAVNFLTVLTAVLLPVDTLSGEIASGVMQTLASKPVRRTEILLGKWLAYWLLTVGYLVLMGGGVLAIGRLIGDITPPRIGLGLPVMLLEGTVLLTLTIAAGTRLSTIANGVVVFGLYGLAFIGGWVEQVGTFAGNEAARRIGIIVSLIMPSESLWQLASHHMQPAIMRELQMTPFSPASVASPAMVAWALIYTVTAVLLAVRGFAGRGL
jgi:ABC-type transport system involved in multi-copper enzyme maturation permease subunit